MVKLFFPKISIRAQLHVPVSHSTATSTPLAHSQRPTFSPYTSCIADTEIMSVTTRDQPLPVAWAFPRVLYNLAQRSQ